MDEEMLRPFFCTQSLGPFVHPGAKLKGGCETKGGCKAATKPTLYTPMPRALGPKFVFLEIRTLTLS